MQAEKRTTHRRTMRYAGWINDGEATPRACVVADMSDTGARLEVDAASDLTESFVLILSGHGLPRRACRVVWRGDREVGVRFEQPTLRKRMG